MTLLLPRERRRILSYHWTPWLQRRFHAFVLSMFQFGSTRRAMREIGVDAEYPAFLFQRGVWYEAPEVNRRFAAQLRHWLASGRSIHDVVRSCERFRTRNLRLFRRLAADDHSLDALRTIYHVLSVNTSFIWLAHGFEDVYTQSARRAFAKVVKGDVEQVIGDVSFPSQKTAHAKFEDAMRRGTAPETLVDRYGWLKVRDGFDPPFTVREIARAQVRLRQHQAEPRRAPVVPPRLRTVAKALQACVYFRTLRTDTFLELFFRARPVFRTIAKKFGIPYERLRYYSLADLVEEEPRDYESKISFIGLPGRLYSFDRPLLAEGTAASAASSTVRGVTAFSGLVRGTVRVVLQADELSKVRRGDILVTNMTTPAFILGMKRAAAFVTDEGGITCHAAIVAREMRKPCVIGTKHATKVFKEGDRVEVDANKGIVRKIQ